MEGLHTARSLLRSGDYMMKLDLKDAYHAVPIHHNSRKYLRFQFEGTTFEFRCLLFGLLLAPWVFTRILHPVVAKLRSEGVQTVIYLDDLLLIHHQKETLMEIFYDVQKLLSSLGVVVKHEKCSPAPTCQLIFLGAVLDTNQMSLALPGEQIDRIQTGCQQIQETGSTTLGELASLLGRMSHAARTGLWEAPLHYRALQHQQASLLHRVGWRPKTPISLNPPSLEDLAWWFSPTLHSHNRQDITPPPFNLTVRTDVSLRGWSATCRGSTTGGRWSVEEQGQHINYLEFKAAFLALRSFLGQGGPAPTRSWDQHPPRHILLEMDNTTAVAYVNLEFIGSKLTFSFDMVQAIGNFDQVDPMKEERDVSLQIQSLKEYKEIIVNEKKRRALQQVIQEKDKISRLRTDMKTKRQAQREAFSPYSKYKEGRPIASTLDAPMSDEK